MYLRNKSIEDWLIGRCLWWFDYVRKLDQMNQTDLKGQKRVDESLMRNDQNNLKP